MSLIYTMGAIYESGRFMTINFLNYNKEIKVQNKKIGKLGNYLNMVYQVALNQVCKSKSGD